MSVVGRIVVWTGKVWVALATAFILLNYAAIWYFQGWSELQAVASPLNIWNFTAVVITVLPGLGLIKLGEHITNRAHQR